jgi:hypothetical protein
MYWARPVCNSGQQQRLHQVCVLQCILTCWAYAVAALLAQVLYQPSWIGYGKTLGEEGEQLFSYLSKLAPSTRNQSRAGVFASLL